jgi:uncharacterized protein (TIGR03663 family)
MIRNVLFGMSIVAVAAGAAALRLPELARRPMHHDEAIHTIRFRDLWYGEGFRYDPHDYHGPTLYYLTLPAVWLSGARDFARTTEMTYRIVPVVCGLGLVLLLPVAAGGLGRATAFCAAVLIAASPAFSFYSRYYIMEMPLVLFTFLAIVAGDRYVRNGQPIWAVLGGGALGLMHATKETCVLIWAAMAVAAGATWLWTRRERRRAAAPLRPGPVSRLRLSAVAAPLVAAVVVSVAAFSVGFTNWGNVPRSVEAWGHYVHRAGGAGLHAQPWHYYFRLLLFAKIADGPVWSEAMIVVLAAAGTLCIFAGRGLPTGDRRLPRFLAFYTITLTALHSVIPYKTPWTILTALHGMTLLAGAGAAAIVRLLPGRAPKALAVVLLLAGAGHLTLQAGLANFEYPADGRNPYVYAQTSTDYRKLVARIEELAAVHPQRDDMLIRVVADPQDYWPLPWDLRRFRRVDWDPTGPAAPVVIVSLQSAQEVDERLSGTHKMVGYFQLRPAVFLALYVESDLWARYVDRVGGARRGSGR